MQHRDMSQREISNAPFSLFPLFSPSFFSFKFEYIHIDKFCAPAPVHAYETSAVLKYVLEFE